MNNREKRRIHMMSVAAEIFLEKGYERASMDEINKAIGCSKCTLYKYFPSKEELFIESSIFTLGEQVQNTTRTIERLTQEQENIWHALVEFGVAYITMHISPRMLKVSRIIISEADRINIGEMLYEKGPMIGWRKIICFIEEQMCHKRLRQADAERVAMLFKGLLDADLIEKHLCGALITSSAEEIRNHSEMAVDTFRRAYQLNV